MRAKSGGKVEAEEAEGNLRCFAGRKKGGKKFPAFKALTAK
jgi:hypothetical protein